MIQGVGTIEELSDMLRTKRLGHNPLRQGAELCSDVWSALINYRPFGLHIGEPIDKFLRKVDLAHDSSDSSNVTS